MSSNTQSDIEAAAELLLNVVRAIWDELERQPSQNTTNGGFNPASSATITNTTAAGQTAASQPQAQQSAFDCQQQIRQTMTAAQRQSMGYRAYRDLDTRGRVVGTLWQTPSERRAYRQTQRRNGAVLVRVATTRGRSYPNRGQGKPGPNDGRINRGSRQ